jgi:hypothetical protein
VEEAMGTTETRLVSNRNIERHDVFFSIQEIELLAIRTPHGAGATRT